MGQLFFQIEQAGKIVRPAAVSGRVGVPQTEPSSNTLFWKNIGLRQHILDQHQHQHR